MIKLLPLILLVSLTSTVIKAQSEYIDFEDTTKLSLIYIDTSLANNIWQIGNPSKTLFNSAYTSTNAIVTDTLNTYPVGNFSSFEITIHQDTVFPWGGFRIPYIFFWHKYDTDSLKDGGYMEVSYDGGSVWFNIEDSIIAPYDKFPADTILGNEAAFTGSSNGWQFHWIYWGAWCLISSPPDSILIRFNFKSDSINTIKEGWMLDNIEYGTTICGGVNEYNIGKIVTITPNPFSNSTIIELSGGESNKAYTFTMYNVLGKKVQEFQFTGSKFKVDRGNLSEGLYIYMLYSDEGVIHTGKLSIQ